MVMNAFERWLITGMLSIVASVCAFFFSVVFTNTSRIITLEAQVAFMQSQHSELVQELKFHRKSTEPQKE
jgi:hypothetical protein